VVTLENFKETSNIPFS